MILTSVNSQLLERYLDLSVDELKNTAANMANIDTPGYKTLGFDFASEMKSFLRTSNYPESGPRLSGVPAGEARGHDPKAARVDGLLSRADGNNVSLDRESMKMAEAQLKFKIGTALLKQEFGSISAAIHADPK
jgi:flagellar basal-body rod protein FlgB